MANTSAIWQQAAHTTYTYRSSCSRNSSSGTSWSNNIVIHNSTYRCWVYNQSSPQVHSGIPASPLLWYDACFSRNSSLDSPRAEEFPSTCPLCWAAVWNPTAKHGQLC